MVELTINIETIKRFFAGHYSRKDFITIREYLDSPTKAYLLRQLMQKHWKEIDPQHLTEGNVEYLLDRLQHKLRIEENIAARKLTFSKVFQKVAAVLILPLALAFTAYLIFQPQNVDTKSAWAEIECPMGVRTRFHLPDGTTGYLNSGSTLKYPVVFENNRQVAVAGEAWFDVEHLEGRPFVVQTGRMNINVLGTEFNVIAYPGDKTEEVILQSGSVRVTGKTGNVIAELKPDERLTVDYSTGQANKSGVMATQYLGWKEGKLIFRNEDMVQVARRLSRWYNADIMVADRQLLQYTFHATLVDEPLDEVLKLLVLTTPILVEETKRSPASDGEYPKRKIVLRLNQKRISQFK